MPFDEWIIVNHPLWKKPAALVGLRDTHFVGYIRHDQAFSRFN